MKQYARGRIYIEVLDVRNARQRGLMALQFTGVVDRGASPVADYVIRDWDELLGLG